MSAQREGDWLLGLERLCPGAQMKAATMNNEDLNRG
jgi:hypothetical protein